MSLTKAGRSLLDSHRDPDREHSQTFYAGLGRARELEHDLQVYRAFQDAETRLLERGAHIERVVLDHELKSEYQRWLHERDKDRDDYEAIPIARPMTFANGRANTTCRTSTMDLIRFSGHLPKGGYDVQTDGRQAPAPAAPALR